MMLRNWFKKRSHAGDEPSGRAGKATRQIDRAVEALRLRLVAGRSDRRARNDALIVVLTSRTSGEGVSTVAVALARSLGRNGDGRVLLVDADDRGEGLVRRLPGRAATIIDGPRSMDESRPLAAIDGWAVDAVALRAGDGRGFAYGAAWDRYLSALRGRYDIIVVDAGSVERGVPYAWAGVASQVLLVIDTTRTTVEALQRFRETLKSSPLTLTGAILNKRLFPIPQFLY